MAHVPGFFIRTCTARCTSCGMKSFGRRCHVSRLSLRLIHSVPLSSLNCFHFHLIFTLLKERAHASVDGWGRWWHGSLSKVPSLLVEGESFPSANVHPPPLPLIDEIPFPSTARLLKYRITTTGDSRAT